MLEPNKRTYLFGEIEKVPTAIRMVHDERFKLIYYLVGNYFKLFDVKNDPNEFRNLSSNENFKQKIDELKNILINNLNNGDEIWIKDKLLKGLPDQDIKTYSDDKFCNQRGLHLHPVNHFI